MKTPCITSSGNEGPLQSHLPTYRGLRTPDGRCNVVASGVSGREHPLPLRFDLRNHSPSGFEWGYNGSGPAQLALALLADACEDPATALRHCQEFKRDIVAGFGETWTLTAKDIRCFVDCQRDGT